MSDLNHPKAVAEADRLVRLGVSRKTIAQRLGYGSWATLMKQCEQQKATGMLSTLVTAAIDAETELCQKLWALVRNEASRDHMRAVLALLKRYGWQDEQIEAEAGKHAPPPASSLTPEQAREALRPRVH